MDEEKKGTESQTDRGRGVMGRNKKESPTMTNALLQMFDGVAGASATCLVGKSYVL